MRCSGVRRWSAGRNQNPNDESGYALPSVLLLLALMTLIAYSVILSQHLRRAVVQMSINDFKAENAAECGVTLSLAALDSLSTLDAELTTMNLNVDLGDGSIADVRIDSWGLLPYVRSIGRCGRSSSIRVATVGMRLRGEFAPAVALGNPSHQLILAGSSFIKGDVVVGNPGVATGQLKDYTQPVHVPVIGRIIKGSSNAIPELDLRRIRGFTLKMNSLLENGAHATTLEPNAKAILSIQPGRTEGFIAHAQEEPQYFVCNGSLTLSPNTQIKGFVAVLASGSITVEQGAIIEGGVLYSSESIRLMPATTVSAQLIAPLVTLEEGSHARYPSLVCSFSKQLGNLKPSAITLKANASVEGALILSGGSHSDGGLIEIKSGASVLGAVYSLSRTTLDGSLTGIVLTREFYFYEAPTSYIGWLRTATIDRPSLPKGYVLPPVFAGNRRHEVLQWY
jgi:hypothetical protein